MKNAIRKLLSKLRFKKVRSRFFISLIALSIPPLFILGYISFNIAKDTLMEKNALTNQDHLETSSEVADLMFRNIVNLNRSIVVNEEIRNDLRLSSTSDPADIVDLRPGLANRLQRVLNNHLLDSRFVDSICLFDLNYEAYCIGRSDDTGIYKGSNPGDSIEQSEWFQRAYRAQGRVLFFSHNVLGDTDRSFSTVKLFRDSSSVEGKPIGLMVINVSRTIFRSIFTGSNQYGGEFMAIDATKDDIHVIYPQEESVASDYFSGSLDFTFNQLQENGYLISQYKNRTTQWIFIHLIEVEELLKQSNKIRSYTTVIALTIALIALVLSYFISGSITRPLLQLKKMMVDWTKGSRNFTETFEQNEVGAIGETFKRMVSENKQLNEKLFYSELKEREAELRALQAQIKPHFLYNTLDAIYWMATLQRNDDVAQMAVSLSESFKLSLNKGKEMIPVYKELEHIKHYMKIQNIRYNHRFHYYEHIDESIMGVEILKLLLQPLVENAIYHGLEPKIGEGTIRLSGRRSGDFLIFIVEDDGVGMDDITITKHGYGLSNVRERLFLYYGSTSIFNVESTINKGTKIEIQIKAFNNEVIQNA